MNSKLIQKYKFMGFLTNNKFKIVVYKPSFFKSIKLCFSNYLFIIRYFL